VAVASGAKAELLCATAANPSAKVTDKEKDNNSPVFFMIK
jgi:hypothetical protein